MILKTVSFAIAALVFAIGLSNTLTAQTISSSIVGSVVDPTDLPVAGVSLELRHVSTSAVRQMATDTQGNFVFSNLAPGEYVLSAEAAGFKKIERKGLMLSSSEVLPVGTLTLAVGSLAETVTVTGQGATVQTASSERSGVVTSTQVEDLLTKSRNVMSLLALLPGVVDTSPDADSLARGWNLYVQGNRNNTNSMTVDGMVLNSWGLGNATDVALSQDSIAEVKVLVGNYQAEYGRKSGANITLVSKSGSQQFHGLVSYFKRHEQFNANNFFRNRTGQAKVRYRYNTWTYNVGGPVYIPGKFNANKDKLFFFWNQEFWPLESTSTGRLTVPTELERAGNFSETVDLNRALIPIRDPGTQIPFSGNIVPPGRINSSGQALLKIFPAPNFTDWNVSRGAYNYIFDTPVSKPTRMETFRADYNLKSNHRISGSFFGYSNDQTGAVGLDTGSSNWPLMSMGYSFKGRNYLTRYTAVLSPTLINEFTAGYTTRPQQNTVIQEELKRAQRATIGFTAGQFTPQNNPLDLVPNATFGGVQSPANLAIEGRFPFWQNGHVISFTNNLTKTLGAHTLKAGITGDILRHHATAAGAVPFGAFDFSRTVVNPLDSNYAYSNALLGVFNTYRESNLQPVVRYRQKNIEWFTQDSWKATRRLTLEYGVRFSWIGPTWDAAGFTAGFTFEKFNPAQQVKLISPILENGVRKGYDPVTGQTTPAAMIGGIAPGSGNPANGMLVISENPDYPRGLYEHRGVQYAPRLGFAYDVFGNGRTAIRGGFGVFYHHPGWNVYESFTIQPPLVITPTVYYGEISTFRSSSGVVFPQTVYSADRTSKTPGVMNLSLSVQHKLPFETIVDIGYSGSLARNLFWTREINAVPMGRRFDPAYADPTIRGSALPTAFLTPITGYTSIVQYEAAASSNYHSLQVSANRRFARGLQFGISWTWSKAMDFVDDDRGGISPFISPRIWNYGLASFDRTHVVKMSGIWDIPGTSSENAVAKAILHGWQLSAMPSFISGAPLGIGWSSTVSVDTTGTPSQSSRIDVIGNPVLPKGERTFERNFRTDVFQMPAVGSVGNAAKTSIRGPGINSWDIGLFKNFPFRDFGKLQFRWEMYNAFNHTQFSALDTAARFDAQGRQVNTQFGQFTAARSPRIMQFALRFNF
jgi:hypothetical protein